MVLELDRRDPFAAGLDDVLRAVGQGDVAQRVDVADVACPQPSVGELLRVATEVVATGDPRPVHFDLADGLAVVRKWVARVVDDAELDPADRPAL